MNVKRVLVTFATTSGSTQEIAGVIADELTRQGLDADLRPCRMVSDLTGVDAVVLGAPLYMFHLHRDALHFLKQHQKGLSARPVAVFAGGAYGPNAAQDSLEVRKNLDAELAKFPWLAPVSVQLVGGRFDPARLRFPYNLIPALKQAPASDARDWEAIHAWAAALPDLFSEPEAARSLA